MRPTDGRELAIHGRWRSRHFLFPRIQIGTSRVLSNDWQRARIIQSQQTREYSRLRIKFSPKVDCHSQLYERPERYLLCLRVLAIFPLSSWQRKWNATSKRKGDLNTRTISPFTARSSRWPCAPRGGEIKTFLSFFFIFVRLSVCFTRRSPLIAIVHRPGC